MKSLLHNLLLSPRYLALLAALVLGPLAANATHIVGGDMSYRLLRVTNDSITIELTLSVYRDCFYGAADAPFDDPAFVGVYDRFNLLRRSLRLPFMGDDTLNTNLEDLCLVNLAPVCVHTSTYRQVVTLPRLTGGYTFAYQRCCRNQTINNIIDPLETGATYLVHVNDDAIAQSNNSPVFKQWPPIYICANRPLVFDHGALDAENDSLVYKLCTPFAGATRPNPQPMPAGPPPYDSIVWQQGYGLNNVLGDLGQPLRIDRRTGVMTAVPGAVGQYVVGVCVEEYDRETGELLSITRRDFQYNVNLCGDFNAAITAPEAQCDDLEVTFTNSSVGGDFFEWYFDWPNAEPGTVTAGDDPVTFTYADTGRYTVALIVEPGTACADTAFHEIYLQNNSLAADLDFGVFTCGPTALLRAVDRSTDLVSPPVAWEWTILYNGITQTASGQNVEFSIPLNTSGTLTLTVTTANGCVQSLTEPFQSGENNPADLVRDTLIACIGQTIGLNPDTPEDYPFTYRWAPATGLSDPNAINPTVLITGDAVYTVTITPTNPVCEMIKTVYVQAVEPPTAAFSNTPACDGLTTTFLNQSTGAVSYRWDFGDPTSTADTSLAASPSYTFPDLGTYQVTLVAYNADGCTDTLRQAVDITDDGLNVGFDLSYDNCSPEAVTVRFTNNTTAAGNVTISYAWSLSNGQVSTEASPVFIFTQNQTLTVTLTATTSDGCSSTQSRTFDILLGPPDDQFPDMLTLCPGETVSPTPGGNTAFKYSWSPATGIDDPTSAKPVFSPTATTTYTVTVQSVGVDTCTVQETVTVVVAPALNLAINGGGVVCDPTTTLVASTSRAATIKWLDSNNNVVGNGPELTVNVSGTTTYTAMASGDDASGCSEMQTVTVSGGPVDHNLADTVAVCLGEEVALSVTNLDPNDQLTYNWTPASRFRPGTANTATPDYLERVGEEVVYVTITNQAGCSATDSVRIAVVDPDATLSFTSEVQCDGATVAFTNTSTATFGYVWNFGDGTISYQANPTHEYASAGTYNVTLSLLYDVDCVAPFTAAVVTLDPQVVADFTAAITDCSPTAATLQFTDASRNTFNNTTSWSWTFTGAQPATSNERNPVVTVTSSGEVTARLIITTANDCSDTITRNIPVDLVQLDLADEVQLCPNTSTVLNPGGNPDYVYQWTPAAGLSATNVASPTASPTRTTTYYVTATSANGGASCTVTDSITVVVAPPIDLDLGPATVNTCGEDVVLTATAASTVTVTWISAANGPIGTGPTITVNPTGRDTITAIAVNAANCADTAQVIVIDNGVDVMLTDGAERDVCQGQSAVFTLANNRPGDVLTYDFPVPAVVTPTAGGATVRFDYATDGEFAVRGIIRNQFGCADTVDLNITVSPFTPSLPDTVTACAGATTPLNPAGNTAYTYAWSPATGLDATNVSNPRATLDASRVYRVSISDPATGCMATDSVAVIVTPAIDLATSNDTSLCTPTPLTLTATTARPVDIQWYTGTTPVGSGATLTVTPPDGTTVYTAIAGDGACADTSSVTVRLRVLDDELPGDDLSICADTPTPLNPGGDPSLTYVWTPTTGLDFGPNGPSNPIATLTEDQTYVVVISDEAFGCTVTDTLTIAVGAPIDLAVMGDTSLCEVAPVSLTATLGAGITLEWFRNGVSLGTGSPLQVTPQDGDNVYTAIATDAQSGCADTSSVTVRLRVLDDELPGDDRSICADTPTPLNPGGDPNLTYVWTPTTGLDFGPNGPSNPIATLTEDQTYVVVISDEAFGCTVTDTLTIAVGAPIDLAVMGDTSLCEIVPVALTATVGAGITVEWFRLGVSVGTGSPLLVTPQDGGNVYTAIATDDQSGCADTSSVTVTVMDLDDKLPADSLTVCPNVATPLNPGGDPSLTYEWTPTTGLDFGPNGPSNPIATLTQGQVYTVVITDAAFGCSVADTLRVGVSPPIGLSAEGDTSLCGGGPVILTAGAQLPDVIISWYDNPDFTGNPIAMGDTVAVMPGRGNIIYYARAMTPNGCQEVETVQVNNLPVLATLDPVTFCEPTATTELTIVNGDPDQQLTATWNPTGVITQPATGLTVTVDPNVTNTFTATVSNQFGCSTELSTTVTIFDLPGGLTIDVSEDTIFLGESAVITVTGCDTCDFQWTVPSGAIVPNNGPIVTVTPTNAGRQEYLVTANQGECVGNRTISLFVLNAICDGDHVFLPNAFSPNGDNTNDVLRIRSIFLEDLTDVEWMIYDRWGEEVFRTQDPFAVWDGTFRGEQLPPDVYAFYLRVVCPNQEELVQKGNITILR